MPTPASGIIGRKIQYSETLADWENPDAGTWVDLGVMPQEGNEPPEFAGRDFLLADGTNIGGGGDLDGAVRLLGLPDAAWDAFKAKDGDADAPVLLRVLNVSGTHQTIYGGPNGAVVRHPMTSPFSAEYVVHGFSFMTVGASDDQVKKTVPVAAA